MFKVIGYAALIIALILAYGFRGMREHGTVYGCSEKELPPDVQKDCKRFVKKRTE